VAPVWDPELPDGSAEGATARHSAEFTEERPLRIFIRQGLHRGGPSFYFFQTHSGRDPTCLALTGPPDPASRMRSGSIAGVDADAVVEQLIVAKDDGLESRRDIKGLRGDQLLVLVGTESRDDYPAGAAALGANITAWYDMRLADVNLTWGAHGHLPMRLPWARWAGFRNVTWREAFAREYVAAVHAAPRLERPVPAAFFGAHNCAEDRLSYVAALSETFPVVSVGRCLHSAHAPRDARMSQYAFCLAFDNSRSREAYLSERLTDALQAGGCVPVYWGSGQLDLMLPHPHAVIDARTFESPHALGKHLQHLIDHPEEYAKHHKWRDQPPEQGSAFEQYSSYNHLTFLPRLCEYIKQRYAPKKRSGVLRKHDP